MVPQVEPLQPVPATVHKTEDVLFETEAEKASVPPVFTLLDVGEIVILGRPGDDPRTLVGPEVPATVPKFPLPPPQPVSSTAKSTANAVLTIASRPPTRITNRSCRAQ